MSPIRSILKTTLLSAIASISFIISMPSFSQTIESSPAFSAGQLVSFPEANWQTNGGNIFNQRHSVLDEINTENVGQLKALRRASLNGSGLEPKHSGQAQILAYEGTLYVVTGNNDVFAVDVDSGEVIWEYKANLNADDVVVCCGWVNRGLGMGDGKIYVGQLDAKLVALDQLSGEVVWSNQLGDPRKGYNITSAPLYYNGMVFTGFAGGDMGIRGRLHALDAETGELVWHFNTIPGPGEFGHDTWPQDSDIWQVGGAAIWQTPAVDPELGMIYFSTSNPAPDMSGGTRPGDNLFSSSMVALDVNTGEYRWHFQEIHHDLWDYDAANPVVLFDAQVDGIERKGILQVPKNGYVFILDRITGEPLIGIDEVPVPQEPSQATAATQPIPRGDQIVSHQIDMAPEEVELVNQGRTFTPYTEESAVYAAMASVSWPPSSYDPDTNLIFICANEGIGMIWRNSPEFVMPEQGGDFLGGYFGRVNVAGHGIVAAVDVRTNKIAWRRQWRDGCGAGSVNTAGGLMFMGRSDGRLVAYDKDGGKKLWEFQVDAPINTTATVFEHNGEQMIAVLAGGTYYSPGKRGDGVWIFSLSGEIESLDPSAAQVPRPAAPLALAQGDPDIAMGETVYRSTCLSCHGETGEGGHGGGAALTTDLSREIIVAVASTGRGDMPAFGSALSAIELRDVSGYIQSIIELRVED